MPRKSKTPLSPTETVRVIAQVYDHYGLDRSAARDRGREAEMALWRAAQDGLLRPPPRKRGPALKWPGELSLELVEAVESVQREEPPRVRGPAKRAITFNEAIGKLRDRFPDRWGRYPFDSLKKRFYEAKREWTYFRRLTRQFSAKITEDTSS
jgi:hypothetical protein